MTPKHTPGPWTSDKMFIPPKVKDRRCGFVVNESNPTDDGGLPIRICDLRSPGGMDGYSQLQANARLIAASPDMHHALTTIADRLEAWAETHERQVDATVGVERMQHVNRAANYRELVRIARESLPKS